MWQACWKSCREDCENQKYELTMDGYSISAGASEQLRFVYDEGGVPWDFALGVDSAKFRITVGSAKKTTPV